MNLKLYKELATWWQLLSPHQDYKDEAALYGELFLKHAEIPVKKILELGSGGGNNAHYLRTSFEMTLVDLSDEMLEMSRQINPDCEHLIGDMRTFRLDRMFDGVLIADAIMYMTTEADLKAAMTTSWAHLDIGGVLIMAPDVVYETFMAHTAHGGDDESERGLRYLEWVWDPDPTDTEYHVEFAYLMKDRNGDVRCESERHTFGLFKYETWLSLLKEVGFEAHTVRYIPNESGEIGSEIFVAVKGRAT